MLVFCPQTVMAVDGLPMLGNIEVPETCLALISTMMAAEIKTFENHIKAERLRYTKLQHLATIDEARFCLSMRLLSFRSFISISAILSDATSERHL